MMARNMGEHLTRFFGVQLDMVGLIVAVGIGGGLFGAAYMGALQVVTTALGPDRWSPAAHVPLLVGVGVGVALLVRWLGRPADVELLVGNIHVPGMTFDDEDADEGANGETTTGHGEGRLRSLVPVSLLCVAAGGTLGPEAPLVTATGTLATRLAVRANLEPTDIRTLAITGMAAGFSVLFGAPLGAAIFALEIPHRRGLEYYEALVPAAIGALSGYAVSTLSGGMGLEPIWHLPAAGRLSDIDLAWAVLAGALGSAIGVAFTAIVNVLHRLANHVDVLARPALGGLILGGLGIASPYALTNGEFQIEVLLTERPVAGALVIAGAFKLLGAAIALTTGWRGGFIIPLFFAGFTMGWAVAGWLPIDHQWMFVAATMVAANTAVTKTPIGSTLVVTEMSGFALGPTTLVGALVAMVLTSPVGLIENQRRRFDAYETDTPESSSR